LLQLLPHCQTLNQPNTHDIGWRGFWVSLPIKLFLFD
jgi:hypothetical protein